MNKKTDYTSDSEQIHIKSSLQVLDKYMELIIPVNVTSTNSSNFNAYCTFVITFKDP